MRSPDYRISDDSKANYLLNEFKRTINEFLDQQNDTVRLAVFEGLSSWTDENADQIREQGK